MREDLTNEELIKEIKKGNKELVGSLYKKVEKLIIKTASDFYKKNYPLIEKTICVDYDDIIQIANMAFIKSLCGFSFDKNILFSTYLVSTIQLTLHSEFYRNKKISNCYQKDLEKECFEDDFYGLCTQDTIDLKILIDEILVVLTKRELEIIKDKFFLELSPPELRNKYGLSSPAIRNIEKKALEKLRNKIRKGEIKWFMLKVIIVKNTHGY